MRGGGGSAPDPLGTGIAPRIDWGIGCWGIDWGGIEWGDGKGGAGALP